MNFGQRPFAYTAPSGYKALCTTNLPTPTIGATSSTRAGKYFNTVLWTGNDLTRTISGVGFQPDAVWIKSRSGTENHNFYDAVRGVRKVLKQNLTNAEQDLTGSGYGLSAFTSDGFSVEGGGSEYNYNNYAYVAWNWKANGAGSSNTAGSITSTVSANTTSGFSIVTYTGTGSAATVGHGLGVAPKMIIIKRRDTTADWPVYHAGLASPQGKILYLDLTQGPDTATSFWGTSGPTSTLIDLGSGNALYNASGGTYVAYCFASIAGYSAFGTYTGNGSADGPFIYTGFRPAFVLMKRCDTTAANWAILDDTRNTSNVVDKELNPNTSGAEQTFSTLDFVSNGIKIRNTDAQYNTNGGLYLYAAFAENPFKYSLAR